MRLFSFSLLIGGGALIGHLYLWLRVVRRVVPPGRPRAVAAALLLAATGLLVFRSTVRGLGPSVARVHDVVAYGWLALALCLVLAALAGDVVTLAVRGASWIAARRGPRTIAPPMTAAAAAPVARTAVDAPVRAGADVPVDASPGDALVPRRRVLDAVPHAVVAGGGLLAGYGSFRAFTAPEVSEVPIRIARLPRALDGLTIVQLTDVHVGSFLGRRFVELLVASANALRPDVVVVTGDLVDGSVHEIGDAVAALGGLRSRWGTHFVTGNHEYYSGEAQWIRFLDRLGVKVLRNARAAIGDGGGALDLVGVDDWSGGRRRGRAGYDLEAALAGRDPDRATVLLAHQPENFEVAVERGVDLQISGHTHGGQVFPMSRLVSLHHRYDRGHFRHGDGHLYVSRGCGFWGPPSRIDSPPELVKLVLVRG